MKEYSYGQPNWLIHRINNEIVRRRSSSLGGLVVDLGCGTAPYRDYILKFAKHYVGVDWPRTMHGLQDVDVLADIQGPLPFEDGSVDCVVAFQVMEHLSDPASFLRECHRILKREGTLLITVPFMWYVHEAPHDYYRYTRYGLEYLLKTCGFVDLDIRETTGFWQMWCLKFNYHTARFARGPLKYCWVPFWWLGQIVSPLLDRLDRQPEETASYEVVARKP